MSEMARYERRNASLDRIQVPKAALFREEIRARNWGTRLSFLSLPASQVVQLPYTEAKGKKANRKLLNIT